MGDKGFNLFSSNRLEHLAEALSRILKKPLTDPFRPECVVVQSRGMARYLSLETARMNGICANMDYPYPNVFVERYLGNFHPDDKSVNGKSVYDPQVLCWKVFAVLPGFLETHDFPELSGYIGGDDGQLKRFQLSLRIGDLFDQYLLFRPDMIKAWENGAGDGWQPLLWRMIRKDAKDAHRLDLFSSFLDAVKGKTVPPGHFPARIFIFGISALPSFYMDVFHAVSGFSEVHLFLLNPCGEYWGDILSERERSREQVKFGETDHEFLYLSRGNRLLGSLGKIGRDFFDLVQKYAGRDISLFQGEEGDTLLSWIKDDIFQLRDPGDKDYPMRTVEGKDRSIQLHSCHSPLREVEVLKDRLYAMFDEDESLNPRDIVVMMADCETYAPLVHSVFGIKGEGRDSIPYSLADRGLVGESTVARVFLALMDMKKSRFTASEVLGFLEEETVRRAFGIAGEDLDTLNSWVLQVNIRWGWDGAHRKRVGLPEFDDCSWMAGLKRLLLGYAMPGRDYQLFSGILPFDGIEGKQGELLGLFMDYAETLYAWVSGLDDPRTPEGWEDHLLGGIGAFFKPDDRTEQETGVLRDEIRNVKEVARTAGVDEPVDFSVMRYHLGRILEKKEQGAGFINGGVTFCAMLPMRSIPFRVICILGMNSGSYPRQGQSCGFDLMAKHPRPGDRSLRNDDRYLFLEALISARDTLYISYTGRSIRDNTLIQPSVLVCELLDYIEAGFSCGAGPVRDRLTLEHPLQPFSPRYFERPHRTDESASGLLLFSFSKDNFRAAVTGLSPEGPVTPFFDGKLGKPEKEFLDVSVTDFCRFFRNPSRFLLEKRLGMVIAEEADAMEATEPFQIKGLDRYSLVNRLVESILDGSDEKALYSWAKATGSLPLGRKGEIAFKALRKDAKSLARGVLAASSGGVKQSVVVDVRVRGVRISGTLGDLYQDRMLRFRPSGVKGKDLLDLWLRHVLLCLSMPGGFPEPARVLGLDRKKEDPLTGFEFDRPGDPMAVLESLADLYLEGLARPLHFFPSASLTLCESLGKDKTMAEALDAAATVWNGNDYTHGAEGDDPWYQLCFKGLEPLDENFVRCSRSVYDPLLDHRRKLPEGDAP